MSSTILRAVEKRVDISFDRNVQTLDDFFTFVSPKAVRLIDVIRDCKPDDNFVIMSGDFDGDFDSDDNDDSDAASDDSMDDDEGPPVARPRKSEYTIQKVTPSSDSGNASQQSSHYIAVRRTTPSADGLEQGATTTSDSVNNDGICGTVFVNHRHIAFALNKLIVELCNWDPDLYFVRSHYIAGYAVGSAAAGLTEAQRQKQENVLRKFRQREYNVLVATTALEEGVDLPRCNLVVRFDRPMTYRSYMLSKVSD